MEVISKGSRQLPAPKHRVKYSVCTEISVLTTRRPGAPSLPWGTVTPCCLGIWTYPPRFGSPLKHCLKYIDITSNPRFSLIINSFFYTKLHQEEMIIDFTSSTWKMELMNTGLMKGVGARGSNCDR